MKRSEINQIIREAEQFLQAHQYILPEFAYWTPKDWAKKGTECTEIRENMLGWDITDYGMGDFSKIGLLLVTVRNGNQKNPEKYPKPYAEKIMIVREEQVTPMHYHWSKMEDIINRGGGQLDIQLYESKNGNELDQEREICVSMDGVKKMVPAGGIVTLLPGSSITLTPGLYHRFWGKPGHGTVLVGEVSMCNDDNTDNSFYDNVGRFPKIEEDEPPYRLLCNEYPAVE